MKKAVILLVCIIVLLGPTPTEAQINSTSDTLVVWSFDVSTSMALGSDWCIPWEDCPPYNEFRYEPWFSAWGMLGSYMLQSQNCDAFYSYEPTEPLEIEYKPCMSLYDKTEMLDEVLDHWPTGWYEFDDLVLGAYTLALENSKNYDQTILMIVNRGPLSSEDMEVLNRLASRAIRDEVEISVVPMGNEPRYLFPHLEPLKRLAQSTGGEVYYDQDLVDSHNFKMFVNFVPEILGDLE